MSRMLYNGVELPSLPDKEGCQYVLLVDTDGTNQLYWAYFSPNPFTVKVSGSLWIYSQHGKGECFTTILTVGHDEAWSSFSGIGDNSSDGLIDMRYGGVAVWANHDILNEDGTLYLAASDPIPVGGAEPNDPAALLMGYRVGQLIRGMR